MRPDSKAKVGVAGIGAGVGDGWRVGVRVGIGTEAVEAAVLETTGEGGVSTGSIAARVGVPTGVTLERVNAATIIPPTKRTKNTAAPTTA